jgi:hypothetical protein
MDPTCGQALDLVPRQRERDGVGTDAGDGADRDRQLARPEEVSTLEHDVRDGILAVDEETVAGRFSIDALIGWEGDLRGVR